MDFETLKWIRAIHIYAFLTWVGGLTGLSFMLKAHSQAAKEAREDFLKMEKGVALAMDIGCTIAIICGVIMLVEIKPSLLKGQGWMHAKLTLVAIVIGIHGFQRMRLGKYKRGEVSPEPAWTIPVLEVAILGIILLAAARPF